jgi:hypothetical protein
METQTIKRTRQKYNERIPETGDARTKDIKSLETSLSSKLSFRNKHSGQINNKIKLHGISNYEI